MATQTMIPSKAQIAVLERLAEGKRLMRQPGGFWVLTGTYFPDENSAEFEAAGLVRNPWYTGTATVLAMETRGWLRRTNAHSKAWKDEREITAEGLAVLGTPRESTP